MSLQTTALENTSIKVGPARKVSCKAKMARRSKKSRKKDGQDRYIYGGTTLYQYHQHPLYAKYLKIRGLLEVLLKSALRPSADPSDPSGFSCSRRRSILKKLSKQTPPPPMQSSRSFSSGFHQSSSDSLSGSPTQSLSPGPSTPCRSPAPDHSGGERGWHTHCLLYGVMSTWIFRLRCCCSCSFCQTQVLHPARAPLTLLSRKPDLVPFMCWVATPKLGAASPPSVFLHHRWPVSHLHSPFLHPTSLLTPKPFRDSMEKHSPLPLLPATLCVPVVQNPHARHSWRGSSQQKN